MKEYKSKFPVRRIDSHKGDYGHVLIVAGSVGFTGAAYLASQTSILSGSGLVTLAIPESLNQIMAVKLTEVMTLPLSETKEKTLSLDATDKIIEFSEKINACAIGPGLSRNKETGKLAKALLKKIDKPVVLDADGINALEGDPEILKARKGLTVITPHPGEMARLLKTTSENVQKDRENVAKNLSVKYNVVTILKGYKTVVANPGGEVYVNNTGNSGMSTAGMGDVLTGIVASFIGQGIDPYSASVLAVYLHGKAGDIVANEKGQFGLIATDVMNKLPYVLKDEI